MQKTTMVMIASPARPKAHFSLFLMITLACLGLFLLDKDIHGVLDLLQFNILVALVIYLVPSFWLCSLLFHNFARTRKKTKSLLLSLSIGIPVSFAFIIVFFYSLRNLGFIETF